MKILNYSFLIAFHLYFQAYINNNLFNHLIGYSLNVLVIYLIINKFINNKVLSIYLSTTCFLASGIIKFQITSTLINYLLIQNRILDYSHISANIDLIFQTLSNFILLLFVYLFINFKETSSIKNYLY